MHAKLPGLCILLFSLLLLAFQPAARAELLNLPPEKLAFEKDIIYGKGGDHDLHVDIGYPKDATEPLPAVLFIHGGGWVGGTHKQYEKTLHEMASHGYFAVAVEYRLSNVAKWPAQIVDCKLAVRWMRANAAKYHVDPNRIAVMGDSAGGHLVTCLGTMADRKELDTGAYPGVSSAVQAVIDYFGPTDFTHPEIYSPAAIHLTEMLFGCKYADNPDLWKSGSPVFAVKAGDPPMLIIHGDSDTLVPIGQSQVMVDALKKAGVECEFVIVKNGEHGFTPLPGTKIDPNWTGISLAGLNFLAKHLHTPAP